MGRTNTATYVGGPLDGKTVTVLAQFRWPDGRTMNPRNGFAKVGHRRGVQDLYIRATRSGQILYVWGPQWMHTEGLDDDE